LDRAHLDRIIALIDRLVAPAGFECLEVEWVPTERALRVYLDVLGVEAGGEGITLDGCVRASRLLDEVQELDDLVPGAYHLEVSSPGIERPLRTRRHFERFVGQTVEVKLATRENERKAGKGKLVGVADGASPETAASITLETDRGTWSFPLSSLRQAHLVHDWGGH
jgi:ribosome maturation factor RimP